VIFHHRICDVINSVVSASRGSDDEPPLSHPSGVIKSMIRVVNGPHRFDV